MGSNDLWKQHFVEFCEANQQYIPNLACLFQNIPEEGEEERPLAYRTQDER